MNYYNHPRGTICVERSVIDIGFVWLELYYQDEYKEWIGCFSVL